MFSLIEQIVTYSQNEEFIKTSVEFKSYLVELYSQIDEMTDTDKVVLH